MLVQGKDSAQAISGNLLPNLSQIIEAQDSFFRSGQTRPYEFRLGLLQKLRSSLQKHEKLLIDALQADLRKHPTESYLSEIGIIHEELHLTIKNLKKWMKPKRVKTPTSVMPAKSILISEPLGRVLIIAPWNYPVQLTFVPLIGAIAAGNTACLKPSELTPNCTEAIEIVLKDCFTPDICAMFKGGAEVSTALLEQRWDHIFFTGSTQVGRIVAQAAAKHLTPCTLELGGKSPCIVTKSCNLKIAARRIVFGKLMNSGQTCVAPDYILVEEGIRDDLISALRAEIEKRYGAQPLENTQLPRIVNASHFQRLSRMINPSQVVVGGQTDATRLLIAPTLMKDVKPEDPVMNEEIFGPILPILTYRSLEEAISFVNKREKPLSLYIYSENKAEQNEVIARCSFGGGCVNDSIIHVGNPHLPFGGVGPSGTGAYHGRYSFDCFSHRKSLMIKANAGDLPLRYAPWTNFKDKIFRFLIG